MGMKHFLSVCHILLYVNIRLRASVVAYENQPVPQNLALVNHLLVTVCGLGLRPKRAKQ